MKCDDKELQRLKKIEHLVWHMLDNAEVRTKECIVDRLSFDKISDLLPEDHP